MRLPWDDLTNDTDGLVSGVCHLVVVDFDDLSGNWLSDQHSVASSKFASLTLVGPSTVVSEACCYFCDVKAFGNCKSFAIIERLRRLLARFSNERELY